MLGQPNASIVARSKSMDNISLLPRQDLPNISLPKGNRSPFPQKNLDPALSALDKVFLLCPIIQGVPVQFGGSCLVIVPSFGPKLGNIPLSFAREIRLPIHVLSLMEAKCHQSVSRSNGKVRDH